MNLLGIPAYPYPLDALEPYISYETMRLHAELWRGYQERANKLNRAKKAGKPFSPKALKFNVNGYRLHDLWFRNLAPAIPGGRTPKISRAVLDAFGGGAKALKKELLAALMGIEGSGWVVLSLDRSRSKARRPYAGVHKVPNHSYDWKVFKPLLVIDVWEHSRILDYGPDRKAYLTEILKLVNWHEVEQRLI